jgi:Ca2+-binding RTX toxin-like protein
MATIYGDNNANTKYGTAYADLIYGRGGNDSLYGRAGDDKVYGELGNDILFGEDGNDSLFGGDGSDTLHGGNGVDALWGGAGNDTLNGNAGNDYIVGESGENTVYGGDGNDRLRGGNQRDALWGGNHDDDIWGNGGDDYIVGGTGNDVLRGHAGFDKLRGEGGNDTLYSGSGDNSLWGGDGNDLLIHEGRPDLDLTKGLSDFSGGAGTDTLEFRMTNHYVDEYNDSYGTLYTYVERDGTGVVGIQTDPDEGYSIGLGSISGTETFRLTSSDHHFNFSSSATVTAYGGSSSDRMTGGRGNQTFYGSPGADEFRFFWRQAWGDGVTSGHDVVRGFNPAEGDQLQFSMNIFDDRNPPMSFHQTESNGNTRITVTRDDTDQVVDTVDIIGVVNVHYSDDYYLG